MNYTRIYQRFCTAFVFALPFILFSVEAFARAGGGSNKGGGIWAIIFYPFFAAYAAYVGYRLKRRQAEVKNALEWMAKVEPEWSEDNLLRIAREKFVLLQSAWGAQDLDVIKKNLHPSLYPDWEGQINTQKAAGEKNVMEGLSISKLAIVDAKNFKDDEKDEFTVVFDAKAKDKTIRNGSIVKEDDSAFREFWTFEREQGEWALREVVQADGWKRFMHSAIVFENSQMLGRR